MPHCILVSHTHWDREWYRTFERFRARLVDTIDRVLDLAASDPAFRFVLDGQTIVLEDYVAIRPERRGELVAACRDGRIAIGPWWVQPDSLLPSGEAHVRNLLEGRRVGEAFGRVSRVAYCPDSFGHPAQFPQLLAGFGLGPFVYWRGNGDEIETLGAEWRWEAPDGSTVPAHHLGEGYFAATGLAPDAADAARGLAEVARTLAARTTSGVVLLMNGFDHALPEAHVGTVGEHLARATGWTVTRGTLDDFAALVASDGPSFRGELTGGRVANLLPGVWSARLHLKLRNRRAEALLEGWPEPWSALAHAHGAPDERPALRAAWRALLQNQAHDSIGGCSQDRVHEQMLGRYDTAEELATETTVRALERIAGLGLERDSPWSCEFDVAVFNPSPHPRTDLVRFRLDPSRWLALRLGVERSMELHPWLRGAEGYSVDGRPARLIADESSDRLRLVPELPAHTLEFVASDVPAFGWRRLHVAPSTPEPDAEDGGREIATGEVGVEAADDGTLTVRFENRVYPGLAGVEDTGDRGDTYDCDPVPGGAVSLESVAVTRRRHANGVVELHVRRMLRVPAALAADRGRRDDAPARCVLETVARLVPGTHRVDLDVRLENGARDHRLRLCFPTGAPASHAHAATTFDVVERTTTPRAVRDWVHPAPTTFPHQGFVAANGLTVVAPALPEAEVTPAGVIMVTLVRAVGWLARLDLTTRPQPAGPAMPTPAAQCLGPLAAKLALLGCPDPRAARDAELGLWAVAAGPTPLVAPGRALVEVAPADVVISALKPAARRDGIVLRLLNPTDAPVTARVSLGLPVGSAVPVRLDETDIGPPQPIVDGRLEVVVPPHGLRSVLLGGRPSGDAGGNR